MYDHTFNGKRNTGGKSYAVRWTAHDESNDVRIFYMLNRAQNYYDYLAATQYLQTPGQNCVFATKSGDIALRTQGTFPAKWKGQGDFVMPGTDSSYMWQGMIPGNETPYQFNPERGFVSSANQRPVDTTYPYYLGRVYPSPRGFIINRRLEAMQQVNVDSMKKLQTDNYNVFAEMAIPLFLKNINQQLLNGKEKRYYSLLQNWDLRNDINSEGATVFNITWQVFRDTVFNDEYANAPEGTERPLNSTLLEACIRDSAFIFLDDITTPNRETLVDITTLAFKRAVVFLIQAEAENKLAWGKYKDTYVQHLARVIKPFSRFHLPIGGGEHVINATKENHGPSWRMIVHLDKETEAWGIYPGGQSGNPSSQFYDQSINKWAAGEYYRLWMMKDSEKNDKRIKWKMQFSK
jgi:penicillin G amidase